MRYISLHQYPDYYTNLESSRSGHRSMEPEPININELGDEWDKLVNTHQMMYLFNIIGITQDEAHILVGPLLTSSLKPDWTIPQSYYDEGFLAKADTLDELARKINVDAQALQQTVSDLNSYAASGKDLRLASGEKHHQLRRALAAVVSTQDTNPRLGYNDRDSAHNDSLGDLQCIPLTIFTSMASG